MTADAARATFEAVQARQQHGPINTSVNTHAPTGMDDEAGYEESPEKMGLVASWGTRI
jgi:hypothetical protein